MRVLGKITITTLIFDDLAELVLPAATLLDPANANVEPPQDPRFQMAKEMGGFVLRVGDVSYLLLPSNFRILDQPSRCVALFGHIPRIVHESFTYKTNVVPLGFGLGKCAARSK